MNADQKKLELLEKIAEYKELKVAVDFIKYCHGNSEIMRREKVWVDSGYSNTEVCLLRNHRFEIPRPIIEKCILARFEELEHELADSAPAPPEVVYFKNTGV